MTTERASTVVFRQLPPDTPREILDVLTFFEGLRIEPAFTDFDEDERLLRQEEARILARRRSPAQQEELAGVRKRMKGLRKLAASVGETARLETEFWNAEAERFSDALSAWMHDRSPTRLAVVATEAATILRLAAIASPRLRRATTKTKTKTPPTERPPLVRALLAKLQLPRECIPTVSEVRSLTRRGSLDFAHDVIVEYVRRAELLKRPPVTALARKPALRLAVEAVRDRQKAARGKKKDRLPDPLDVARPIDPQK